jgi:hypothetical protein
VLRTPLVTAHAVERYIERVKPCCSPGAAKGEILALCRTAGEPSTEPPSWKEPGEPCQYLEVVDGIAFVFQEWKLTTVVTRGSQSDSHKRAKHDRKKKKRAERASKELRSGQGVTRRFDRSVPGPRKRDWKDAA